MGPVFTPKWIVPFQLMTKLHKLEEDKSKIGCMKGGRLLNQKASFSFHVVTKQSQFKFEPWDAYFLCHFMLGSKWRKSRVISSFLQNFTENWGGLASPHHPLIAQSIQEEATLHPGLKLWSNLNVACSECSHSTCHQIKSPDKKLPIQMFLVLPLCCSQYRINLFASHINQQQQNLDWSWIANGI